MPLFCTKISKHSIIKIKRQQITCGIINKKTQREFKFANVSQSLYSVCIKRCVTMMEYTCPQNGGRPLIPRRIISKYGERNINFTTLPQRSIRYIQDFVNTVVSNRIYSNIQKNNPNRMNYQLRKDINFID